METLCISEGRTIGFSEEQGEMEAYLEVPSQLFSLYIVSFKSEESIFQHWFAELAQFEFKVIHKKGIENINADALS